MTRERAAELLSEVIVLDDPEMAEAHRVAISALRQQEESLQKKLGDILSRLEDKSGKLRDAERKLSDLRRQMFFPQGRSRRI